MTLDEAIQTLVDGGENDPLTVARNVIGGNDSDWLREQLGERAEEIVTDYARRHFCSARRSAENQLAKGSVKTTAVLKVRRVWIPETGYKRYEDLTAADLRARAEWYRQFAQASLRRADWCDDVAELMESEGARTLGALSVPVPPLPQMDSAPEIAAAS